MWRQRSAAAALGRRAFSSSEPPPVRVLCNGVWDMFHVGHANAWLQARLTTGAPNQHVSIVVALHDSADTETKKGRPTIFDDAERQLMAQGCKWVDETVPNVPYDIITEELMDTNNCAWVSHGDDMIILPGKPHMYSEAEAAGRFKMFPRTPGISTTSQRQRVAAALAFGQPGAPSMSVLEAQVAANRSGFVPGSQHFAAFGSGWNAGATETVYAHGAFDLFNPGDVAFLEAAADQQQRLVVGLLSDADVAMATGNPFLPIIPLKERALALLSHEAVDDVLLGVPLEITPEFLEEQLPGLAGVVVDPRNSGRYTLPPSALAAVEAAGLVRTVSMPQLSVGLGDGNGGHLTSDSVLARQASAAAALMEENAVDLAAAGAKTSLHTGSDQWVSSGPNGQLFPTSVVGSLPRPEFVRELMLGGGGDGTTLHAAISAAVAMQLQAGCDVVTDGELGRLSYIGIIAELANGFEITQTADNRPYTVVKKKLSTKKEGILVQEAERLQGILAELGVPDMPYKMTIPAPALLGERMWVESESSDAYSCYEDFTEDTVSYLRKEMELMLASPTPPAVLQIDDPHLCLFVDDVVRAKYADAEKAASFAVDMTNRLTEGLVLPEGTKLAVHLCRRAGGKARGEHEFDGNIARIIHHINALQNVQHLTIECTTPDQVNELQSMKELRDDFEIGFGCVSCEPGCIDSVDTIMTRVRALLAAGVAPERVTLNPDCGFAPGMGAVVDPDEVYTKLKNQGEAAMRLRQEYEIASAMSS